MGEGGREKLLFGVRKWAIMWKGNSGKGDKHRFRKG